MNSIRSMTGYARVTADTPAGAIVVTLKSVNHRSLDLHFHLPAVFEQYEIAMRAVLKKRLARGHIDIRLGWEKAGAETAPSLNRALAASVLAASKTLTEEYGVARGNLTVGSLLAVPGMLSQTADGALPAEIEGAVLDALGRALDLLDEFREREGAELATILRGHNAAVLDAATKLEALRGEAQSAIRKRLEERVEELLNGSRLDPQRLAQEVVLLAERSDISEEIARLRIHAAQLDQLLDAGGDAGKKLDFLLQEMNRETNTILSKTSGVAGLGIEITDLALAAKSHIEKIREQSLNLE